MARNSAEELIDATKLVRETAARAKLARLESEKKALARELEQAEQRFAVLAELDVARRPLRPLLTALPKVRGKASRRVATAVALASDWHVEERVDPKTIDGMNAYSPAVAERRARRFFEGIEWLVREPRFQVQDLLLWLGGDLITGYIHEELLEGNFLSPTEAVLFAQRLISDGLRALLSTTQLNINVECSIGNHGRTTAKPRVATAAANSFEWLLYHILAKEFSAEPRVQFRVCDGHHSVVSIGDYRIHFTHGDKVKSMGGIGGVDVPLNRAIAQWHRSMPAHVTCVGHFHDYQSGERLVRNGSLIGYNAFARDIVRAPFAPPVQAFFLVDEKRGKTFCAPIWTEERK